MYSKDIRNRVSTYDRMRADQEKLNKLSSKMRDLKQKLKTGAISTPGSPTLDAKRGRSLSPSRTLPNFDLVDPSAFG
jgi:hypothetical protein